MKIGVPKEVKNHEYRVAITPAGVHELVANGHSIGIQAGAGTGSAISDAEYAAEGAEILPSAEEVWGSADMVMKVKEPVASEYPHLRPGLTLFTYLHLAAERELTEALMKSGATGIAYETVELDNRMLPLLAPMSEVAGRMSTQVGARLLEREAGGRGILMGGVTGVRPAKVVVLGAGIAGMNAARIAAGMEAEVVVLDTVPEKLHTIDVTLNGRVLALMSNKRTLEQHVLDADIVIGSVLIAGAKAPKLVTAEHVRQMRTGSVLIDISIDQGGCFETSHVTTHDNPTYVIDGVVHYSVGNMPGAVPYTSTYALTNVTLPYALRLANGVEDAVRASAPLAKGVNVWNGTLTNEPVATAHAMDWEPLDELFG